jgi:endonuclease-3
MNLGERIQFIDRKLDELYPKPPIPLDHQDPYTLLVAVLLSAQCTDARVNKITPSLFELADNPNDMANQFGRSDQFDRSTMWLAPRKAKAIRDLSSILIDQYQGVVPSSFEALESLPWSGP